VQPVGKESKDLPRKAKKQVSPLLKTFANLLSSSPFTPYHVYVCCGLRKTRRRKILVWAAGAQLSK